MIDHQPSSIRQPSIFFCYPYVTFEAIIIELADYVYGYKILADTNYTVKNAVNHLVIEFQIIEGI